MLLLILCGLCAAAPGLAEGATGSISGTVTNASKAPIAEAEVTIYNAGGGYVFATETDQNGNYTVTKLPEADYKVGFTAKEANYIAQYYKDSSSLAGATTVALEGGASISGINAQLATGGSIEGTVTDALERPIAEAEVQVYNGAHDLIARAQTGLAGTYAVTGLAEAGYVVEFVPPAGYSEDAPEYYHGKYSFAEAGKVSVKAGSPTPAIDAQLAEGGRIEGTVTDALTKEPLEGVEVQVSDTTEPDTFVAPVETASGGTYVVKGLAPGSYTVKFTPTGGYSVQYYEGKATLAEAKTVAVTTGGNATANAALSAGGRISGTVTSAASKDPLGEVEVSVFNASGEYVQSVETEAEGKYTVLGLPEGEYEVGFLATGGGYGRQYYKEKATLAEASRVKVVYGSATSEVNAALSGEGSISGTVTNSASKDLAGVEVLVYDAAEELITSAQTDANGTYTVPGLAGGAGYVVEFVSPSGEYTSQYYEGKAKFSEAKKVAVIAAKATSGVNAAMAAARGSLSGDVTSVASGKGVANVAVKVYEAGAGQVASAVSSSTGEYKVSGLAPGSYEVEFVPPTGAYLVQYYGGGSSLAAASPVTVTAGETTGAINAALQSPGAIEGKVTDAATDAAVSGVEVEVYDAHGDFVAFADSAANGSYTVSDLATGSYVVEFVPAAGYLGQYYSAGASPAEATEVRVTAGQTTGGIDAALAGAGEISGSVTSASTHLALAAEVQVYDTSDQLIASAQTEGDGDYTVGGLASGGYVVEFVPSSAGYARQFYDDATSFGEATGVSVSAGSTKAGIDAALSASGSIAGTVTSAATHDGIPGVEVDVYDEGEPIAAAQTGSNGTYTVSGLPAGSYEVEFLPSAGNYLPLFYKAKHSLAEASEVSVTPDATSGGIDGELAAGGEISGTVYKPGGTTVAPNVEAVVYNSISDELVGSATTGAGGTYTVEGLPSGEYKVGFNPLESEYPGGEYAPQYYDGFSTFGEATRVTVAAGASRSGINATLAAPGAIEGTVTNTAASHEAIAGVVVKIYDLEDTYVTYAETVAGGKYKVSGLAAGKYAVEFAPPATYLPQYYQDKSSFADANLVTVTEGATTQHVNAALAQPGAISGTVKSAATKAGLEGVEVKLFEAAGDYVTSAQTGAGGVYTVSGLAAGKYKVEFLASSGGYAPQYYEKKVALASATEVTVAAAETTPDIGAELTAGGQIAGVVTNAVTKAALAGVRVSVYEGQDTRLATAETSVEGKYTIAGLATGSYEVEFVYPPGSYLTQFYNAKPKGATSFPEATKVALTAPAKIEAVDAELEPAYGSLAGTVTSSSAPAGLEHVQVRVYDAADSFVAEGETAAAGKYTINGLAPGSYEIRFSAGGYLQQYYTGKSSLTEATPVAVTPGATKTGVNALLAPGGEISGKVTEQGGSHAPLANVLVKVYNASDAYVAKAETSSTGEYTVSGLAEGTYEVGFAGGSYAPEFYTGSLLLAGATTVTVTAGKATPGVDAALATAGSIEGIVTAAASGLPLAEVEVNVYDANGTLVASEETEADGTYRVGALAPGSYEVQFVPASGGLAAQFYGGAASLAVASRVSVSAGVATSSINAALAPAPPPQPKTGLKPPVETPVVEVVTASSAPQFSLAGPITGASGGVHVPLRCAASAGSCAPGAITVTVVEKLRKGRLIGLAAKNSGRVTKRTVTVGVLKVTLGAGESRTFAVSLNATGKKLLAAHRTLAVEVQVTCEGKTLAKQAVSVAQAKARKKKRA